MMPVHSLPVGDSVVEDRQLAETPLQDKESLVLGDNCLMDPGPLPTFFSDQSTTL